jgi:DNA-binding NarL/FixJ family response regulator
MGSTRILLVDDYKLWRLTARSILEDSRKFRIIAEASDGLEAIEKAATLHPDVVLLDIGLPLLNGIEAAKKIRQTCPESKIIFLTQEQDGEVRCAALATGAAAYIMKSRAACELQHTIESVMVNTKVPGRCPQHHSPEPAILSRDPELSRSPVEPGHHPG